MKKKEVGVTRKHMPCRRPQFVCLTQLFDLLKYVAVI